MNQSIRKALLLLDLFTDEGASELSLQEISTKAKMPKSTAYRLLTTLETGGFLYKTKESEHDSRYRLGLKLLELGELVSERLELRGIALPFMEKLAEEINEVVHLVIVNQQVATYIEKVDSTRAFRLNTRIGKSSPLYLGSGPKMLLAFLPKEKQQQIINQLAHEKIKSDHLFDELAMIREKKYAYSIGEQDADTTGISYPIFDYRKQVIASLAVSGLASHFVGDRLQQIKQQTKQTARLISRKLGYLEAES